MVIQVGKRKMRVAVYADFRQMNDLSITAMTVDGVDK